MVNAPEADRCATAAGTSEAAPLSDEQLEMASGAGADPADEQLSLRLQMLMDRQAKALQAMSNLLKKMNDAQQQIVRNLR
jgi:hypothetical protein